MSKKRLTVVYSAQAMENAREIVNYLQNKFSDREVDKFRRILSDFERIIGLFPSLYPQSTKLMSVGQY
jgi:plasmid stabilization system protein ParE